MDKRIRKGRVALVITLLIAMLVTIGCLNQSGSIIDVRDAQQIVNSMTYVRSPKGECFGVVASRKAGELAQNGFTMTWVPSTQCK